MAEMQNAIHSKISGEIEIMDSLAEKAGFAIAFSGGFALSVATVGEHDERSICPAFYNVFFNYLKKQPGFADVQFEVFASCATISLASTAGEIRERLTHVLNALGNFAPTEAGFSEAKAVTEERFKESYKSEGFRAYYKAAEYLYPMTGYCMKNLVEGLRNYNYESFSRDADMMINCANLKIYILTGNSCLENELRVILVPESFLEKDAPLWSFASFDPYDRMDAHVVDLGRNAACVSVITLDFPNWLHPGDRLSILELFAVTASDEHFDIQFDFSCTGLTHVSDVPISLKSLFSMPTEDRFPFLKQEVLYGYARLMEERFPDFLSLGAQLQVMGVSLGEHLNDLASINYEQFTHLWNKADPILHEAQVVVKGGLP